MNCVESETVRDYLFLFKNTIHNFSTPRILSQRIASRDPHIIVFFSKVLSHTTLAPLQHQATSQALCGRARERLDHARPARPAISNTYMYAIAFGTVPARAQTDSMGDCIVFRGVVLAVASA